MKSSLSPLLATLFVLALTPLQPALAAQHEHDGHAMETTGHGPDTPGTETGWSEGTVKKVNPDAGKVTLSHGPLPRLDMPAMTMVFRVKDPAWLAQMKPGDRIRFVADRVGGALTVTDIQSDR